MADYRNAVSQLHGKVARRMWHALWPTRSEEQVPILAITNGVHVPTWCSDEINELFVKYLDPDWAKRVDDSYMWQRVMDIPDKELWEIRINLKRKLMHIILERCQEDSAEINLTSQQMMAEGALFGP